MVVEVEEAAVVVAEAVGHQAQVMVLGQGMVPARVMVREEEEVVVEVVAAAEVEEEVVVVVADMEAARVMEVVVGLDMGVVAEEEVVEEVGEEVAVVAEVVEVVMDRVAGPDMDLVQDMEGEGEGVMVVMSHELHINE